MSRDYAVETTSPKRWVARKFIQAILGAALIVIASAVWVQHQLEQRAHMREIHYQTGYALATTFVAQLDLDNLADSANQILNFTQKPAWLHNISVHDMQGRVIFDQSNDDILMQSGVLDVDGIKLIPIVIELKQQHKILGYLRASINLSQMQQAHDQIVLSNSSNSRLVFFLIAAAGLFVSRTFYKSAMQKSD
ncbi:hypothetical protein [Catenovulum agarivorans]|uniref:hypothetical protein n=1 Tax=Catenovulum agarivorans TaxID=1172192 RepID=UPI00036F171D|nr:hypothetical protein [Catenovulum agarivorans]